MPLSLARFNGRGAAAAMMTLALVAGAMAQGRGSGAMKETLLKTFDMSNAIIDVDELLAPGVAKDGIPALTNPERTNASSASYPEMDGRVVTVQINGEAVAYPIGILTWHEAVNDVVGGVPILVTYCPLCDSAAVADRRIMTEDGKDMTLDFGISGFLYNSNMVMYDKTSNGIWSQVYMRAMTGPIAGARLKLLPVRVEPFSKFIAMNPRGKVLTTNTGYTRSYDRNPYQRYFNDQTDSFHEFKWRDDLPIKTLGAGVLTGDDAVFVTVAAIDEHGGAIVVPTKNGDVMIERTTAGITANSPPEGVNVMQVFWHSWSAFYPKTAIMAAKGEGKSN